MQNLFIVLMCRSHVTRPTRIVMWSLNFNLMLNWMIHVTKINNFLQTDLHCDQIIKLRFLLLRQIQGSVTTWHTKKTFDFKGICLDETVKIVVSACHRHKRPEESQYLHHLLPQDAINNSIWSSDTTEAIWRI